ncbi:hypothetical protein HK405_009427 [Cladochytrium tenue]|nr:hypothetical protein HK405_009427 [Cladochytrium tenue]
MKRSSWRFWSTATTGSQEPATASHHRRPPLLPAPALSVVFKHLCIRDTARASRVCRAWAAAARPVLYESLSDSGLSLWSFEKVLAVSSPGILQRLVGYVRHLALDSSRIKVLEEIARAGGRPTSLDIHFLTTVSKVMEAMGQIGDNVTHLTVHGDPRDAEKLASLFPGPLSFLCSDTIGRVLLKRNCSSLRSLTAFFWEDSAIPELIEFFGSKPPLRALSLYFWSDNQAPSVLQAIRDGCGETLTEFRMVCRSPKHDRGLLTAGFLLYILTGLRKLERLSVSFECVVSESISMPVPTTWPPITVLKLNGLGVPCLQILAGVASTIRSLHLCFNREADDLPLKPLQNVLNAVGAPCFSGLRNLQIEMLGMDSLTTAKLAEVVDFCPNLETLELRADLESLQPLEALVRLRYLNLHMYLWNARHLIDEAADLVLQRDHSTTQVEKLRVFLCDDSRRAHRAALSKSVKVKKAARRTGGRVQFFDRQLDLPAYF